VNSGKAAAKRTDGMPVGTPFQPGQSGNAAGRPKGALNLSTHIRNILEGGLDKLPKAITETIQGAVGEERAPLEAMIIVGLLQALQGDKGWADWLSHNGYGKPLELHKLLGDPENPIALDGTLKVVLVKPAKESADE
jgi:uncharacterized protein DUF5681